MLNALHRAGARVTYLGNAWGAERDAWIARSHIVLNMHFHRGRILEVVRIFYLLANGVFVVSETPDEEEEMHRFRGGMAFADYGQLAHTCLRHLADAAGCATVAARGREVAAACPQKSYLSPVLDAMLGDGLLLTD